MSSRPAAVRWPQPILDWAAAPGPAEALGRDVGGQGQGVDLEVGVARLAARAKGAYFAPSQAETKRLVLGGPGRVLPGTAMQPGRPPLLPRW